MHRGGAIGVLMLVLLSSIRHKNFDAAIERARVFTTLGTNPKFKYEWEIMTGGKILAQKEIYWLLSVRRDTINAA